MSTHTDTMSKSAKIETGSNANPKAQGEPSGESVLGAAPCYAQWELLMVCPHCGYRSKWNGVKTQHCGECTETFISCGVKGKPEQAAKKIFNAGFVSEQEIAEIIKKTIRA